MDNNLFYEVFNATATSEIKTAYETAVANNRKYYRCFTTSGKMIGWDGSKHISETDARNNHPELLAEVEGGTWFINPQYKAEEPTAQSVADEKPVEEQKPAEQPKQPLKPAQSTLTSLFTQNEGKGDIAPLAKMRENLAAAQASIADMQDKYSASQNELITARGEIQKRDDIIAQLKKRVSEAEKRADDLDEEEESAADTLEALRDAIKTMINIIRGANDER